MRREDKGLLSMGEVKQETGLTERRIRYYEQQGLLRPLRTDGHQRLYTAQDVHTLKHIKRLLASGMTLKDVKALLVVPETDAETGDALTYFRGQEWVHRRGQMGTSLFPLTSRPDVMRRIDRDPEE